jgi:hypothetical protein
MSNNKRILNITRGFTLKHKQALRAVNECACAWVEYGVSVSDLTLAESITLRNQQASVREPLASPELPGLTFQPPLSAIPSIAARRQLVQAANQFVAENA